MTYKIYWNKKTFKHLDDDDLDLDDDLTYCFSV